MLHVKTPEEALTIIRETFSTHKAEHLCLPIEQSYGYILAQDIKADEYVPPFNRSTVDGYAVLAADTFGCSESIPAILTYDGEIHMGETVTKTLKPGTCIYVPTGGQLPEGADAMVMIEYAEDFQDGMIYIQKSAAPGQSIIFKGDDTIPGRLLVPAGREVDARIAGTLAAAGISSVPVFSPLRIGIISTGDELVPPGQTPVGSQIRDVNTYTLIGAVRDAGAVPVTYGIIPDRYDDLAAAARKAAKECDMILISGGSSVGAKDATSLVLENLSDNGLLFHGISIKPGKPTILAGILGKPAFGLPGHPVAVYFIFHLFVRAAIAALTNTVFSDMTIDAVLDTNVPSNGGREECLPVHIHSGSDGHIATPIFGKSGLMTILSRDDGYIRIPRNQEGYKKDAGVKIHLF